AVYGCDGHVSPTTPFFSRPGVRETAAIREGNLFDFPCNLTCRAGIRSADFVSWLSARLYEKAFAVDQDLVLEERVVENRPVPMDLSYIAEAKITRSRIYDFPNQTLLVTFAEPMTVISTLEGPRQNIRTIGNHYAPPPLWKIAYGGGVSPFRKRLLSVLQAPGDETALLFTGADMEHLAAASASFRDLSVTALVTAGVAGNAMRMGADAGGFYEPGTINLLVLPGARLTDRAMSRALITATEAKTAALLDLDVRSTYSAGVNRATGTGTDNIIVAEGRGPPIDNTGGHSKMGELIARAVHSAVSEAVLKQNGIYASRNAITRLAERGISLFAVLDAAACECIENKNRALETLEQILLVPRYAGFMETAFALSDAAEKGLVGDLNAFEEECRQLAREISGTDIDRMADLVRDDAMPRVLRLAVNGLLNGIRKWPEEKTVDATATEKAEKR
ncbi:MAG: adenosylcobinamide amidohydrolase, partial [Desulfobacterales bacterium]